MISLQQLCKLSPQDNRIKWTDDDSGLDAICPGLKDIIFDGEAPIPGTYSSFHVYDIEDMHSVKVCISGYHGSETYRINFTWSLDQVKSFLNYVDTL